MEHLTVHVLLYREDDRYVAHCLEFDLVAQGETTDEAFQNLLDAIELQTTYSQEIDDVGNLIHLAPIEYWRMLARSQHYIAEPAGWRWPSVLVHADCGLVKERTYYGQADQVS